jgi:hypothetical protein
LLGEGDLVVAHRDTFPGLGKISTTWLVPGTRWADRYVLQVSESAYTPDTAVIEVGLYDASSGPRLPVIIGGENAGDHVRFGEVAIRTDAADVPNPVSVNFGNRMELVGYDLSRRVVRPGESITLLLYWKAMQEMESNYTISAQFIDSEQRKAAQVDAWPQAGDAPTSIWTLDQTVSDTRELEIFNDALPGVYDVRLAVYLTDDSGYEHLAVIPQDGSMPANYVLLTRVRVVE